MQQLQSELFRYSGSRSNLKFAIKASKVQKTNSEEILKNTDLFDLQVHRLFEKPNFLVQNLQYVSPLIILKVLIFEVISNVSSALKEKKYSIWKLELSIHV